MKTQIKAFNFSNYLPWGMAKVEVKDIRRMNLFIVVRWFVEC